MQIIQAQSRFGRVIVPRESIEADPRWATLGVAWHRLQRLLQLLSSDQSVQVVHDVRVQIRSFRALLRVLRAEANPIQHAALCFDLANLGRHLAEARTADAHLRLMRELSSATRHLNTKDMLTMIALCERRATAERKSLTQRLREPAWSQRIARIAGASDDSDFLLRPKRHARKECRAAMEKALRGAARELRTAGTTVRALHRQRLHIKHARYVCEQIQTLAQIDGEHVVRILSRAQDTLGEARDLQQLAKWVRTTPIPQALRRPLLDRIDKSQGKLISQYRRKKTTLRRALRAGARSIRAAG